ncbi:RNA 3'-terminal phosphate cyclase [Polyplosphaeria fusca]|uniref:RNA 3'-terminal phosphate cyclase n=1 Tax=Polyplosphaeria fusca TaxID=682080 RepID=A0A9P4QUE1_9PLEO|nr:RNA 3'-terminal phosphate cyclase [Polyplosphaeria fusca]
MPPTVHLEGTTLEGGGQLLRLATCLSSLTLTPIRITSIRGKRSGGGGLKSQHLTSIQYLASASSARLSGAGLKSREITFKPPPATTSPVITDCYIQQSTPGSVNLILQAVLPYILLCATAPVRIKISGGTNVSNSPSVDYVRYVLFPMLEHIGIPGLSATLHSRGWSTGSTRVGSVTYTIPPLQSALPGFCFTQRGDVVGVKAVVLAPRECEARVREELDVVFAKRREGLFGNGEGELEVEFEDSHHEKRYYLLLVATTGTEMRLGRDWLYDGGVRAGKGDRVVQELVKKVFADLVAEIEHEGCVDEYLRDQLVVFQALARGKSEVDGGRREGELVEASLHARTAQWVVGEILGVHFDEKGGCEGVEFVPGTCSSHA